MTAPSPDKHVIACRLAPTPAQRRALDATRAAFAAACRQAMRAGRAAGTTANAVIHRRCYRALREQHGLSANLAIRAIARAARRLKGERGPEIDLAALAKAYPFACEDARGSSIDYDARIMSFSPEAHAVSLSTVEGRVKGIRMTLAPGPTWRLHGARPRRATLAFDPDQGYWMALELALPAPNEVNAHKSADDTA